MQRAAKVDQFRFHYVKAGNRLGFRATKGRVGERVLTLGEDHLPFDKIIDTTTRGNRVVLALSNEYLAKGQLAKNMIEGRAVVLEPVGSPARALEKVIDCRCADLQADRHRAELEASGQQHLIRIEVCPACGAKVDLSGLKPTTYVYCRYCESIFSDDRKRVTNGDTFRVCDDCGMFDRIQEYPEFYFYFLLVVYGFSYRQRFLCDNCAHRLFVRTLAANALFVIGIPTAIWVKLKSGAGRDPGFPLLAEANALALAGRYRDADENFLGVLRTQRDHPAILMNQALGHALGGDQRGAAALLEKSLAACNHYIPVLRIVQPD